MELESLKEEKELEQEKKEWELADKEWREMTQWQILLCIIAFLSVFFFRKADGVIMLVSSIVITVLYLISEVLRERNRSKEGKSLKSLFKSCLKVVFWFVLVFIFIYAEHRKDNLFFKVIYYVLLTLFCIFILWLSIMRIRFEIKQLQSRKKKSKKQEEELKRKYIK